MTSLPQNLTPIQDTTPFINLGYHTVPLLGKHIKRNELGKKYGYSFTSNWQETHSKTLNEFPSPIGGLLTSQLVAIDCDCETSYRLFRQLDPDYQAYFDSIGKLDSDGNLINCGTILYQHSPDLPPSKKLKGELDIDWFNSTGMVFLPTASNETKTPWQTDDNGKLFNHKGEPVTFSPMPPLVKQVLELALHTPKDIVEVHRYSSSKGYLALQAEQFHLKHGEYEPAVTRILTPKEAKQSKLFKQQGHLHPQEATNIMGRHDYLFKIFCTLAGDNTVDRTMALDIIMYINSLLSPPRSAQQMHSEIIDGIISGRQKNQAGDSYWVYDEHWEENRSFTAVSKTNADLLHIFYDPFKKEYFIYNTMTDKIDTFGKKQPLMEHISAISIGAFNQKEEISNMVNLETVSDPAEDYGYLNDDSQFNLFKSSEALNILRNPETYKDSYTEPKEFIAFINSFIPEKTNRLYFLGLVRRKLTTFKYSPVVPNLIGVQGSGKGLLTDILKRFIGKQYVKGDVGGEQFMEKYNDWILDKWFIVVNEISNTVNKAGDKSKAQGILKNYTGSKTVGIRSMNTDYFEAPMNAMWIVTANANALAGEDEDRRNYIISTPNKFDDLDLVLKAGDPDIIYQAILNQINDIAYYLATEVRDCTPAQYIRAPQSASAHKIIFDGLPVAKKMAFALQKQEYQMLYDYLESMGATQLFNGVERTKRQSTHVYLNDIVDSYRVITNDTYDIEKSEDIVRSSFKEYKFTKLEKFGNSTAEDSHGNRPQGYKPEDIELFIVPIEEAEDIDLEEVRI